MAAGKEVAGLRSIAEKLQGRWEEGAGVGQRTQEEEHGCKTEEVLLSRRYWQVAESCEVELKREQQAV